MARMPTRRHGLLPLVLALGVTACGGGGSTLASSPVVTFAKTPSPTASATPSTGTPQGRATKARVVIHIPPKSAQAGAARRRPAYISAGTNSVSITVDNSANPVSISLLPTVNPNCTAATSGTSCTISVDVPAAASNVHTFAFTAYDANDNPLSTNTVMETLIANTTNTLNVTLNGIPASVTAALAPTNGSNVGGNATEGFVFVAGSPLKLTLNALDIDGYPIIGQGAPTFTISGISSATLQINATQGAGAVLFTDSVSEVVNFTVSTSQLPNAVAITTGPVATGDVNVDVSLPITLFSEPQNPPFTFSFNPPSPATLPPNTQSTIIQTSPNNGYIGPVNITTSCSVAPSDFSFSGNNPIIFTSNTNANINFSVENPDICTATFTDAFGDAQTLTATIPGLVVKPIALIFNNINQTQTLALTDIGNPSTTFSISNMCGGIANVTLNGATVSVTSLVSGNCGIIVTDSSDHTSKLIPIQVI
jgi:hypothetical protein